MAYNPPSDPINVPLRPLNKGMRRDLPPTGLPPEAGWTVGGYIVTTQGLRRRPAWQVFAADAQLASLHQPVRDIATVWNSTGDQTGLLIGEKFLYGIAVESGYTGKYWTYSAGFAKASGTFIVGSGSVWLTAASELQAGDTIKFSTSSTEFEIAGITTNTKGTITATTGGLFTTKRTYHISRAFKVPSDHLIDYAVCDYKLILADGSRFLYAFDGDVGTFGDYNSAVTYVPRCVLFFADRLWIAHVTEGTTMHRQRIRWSSATDRTSFDAADYYDLPYSAGAIRRLMPLGNILMCYLEDAVFFGRPSNLVDLPYSFTRIETGGRGLVGPRAVVSWLDSNYFVAQDDIYQITSDLTIKPIGSPVVVETLKKCNKLEYIRAVVDPENDRIIFGFPESGDNMAKFWSYNYKSQAWSYEEADATALATAIFDLGYTWNDLTGLLDTDSWTGFGDLRWSDLISGKTKLTLYRGINGKVQKLNTAGSTDPGDVAPSVVYESGDFDFGEPDLMKSVLRLSVRITREEATTGAVAFTVQGSGNSGGTWKNLGVINIASTKSEGFINFRMTGSIFRFKLTSGSNIAPYVVTEVVLRVRGRGLEVKNV